MHDHSIGLLVGLVIIVSSRIYRVLTLGQIGADGNKSVGRVDHGLWLNEDLRLRRRVGKELLLTALNKESRGAWVPIFVEGQIDRILFIVLGGASSLGGDAWVLSLTD